ncbi:MAG: protein phosphatase 2C domain-containing protein [Anaerolineales bacterium]|nr:protein phosphatase 2C domain-containing protein [Anaerolineales bacterium]
MIHSTNTHLHVAVLSHPGMTGKNNEDRYAVSSYTVSKDDAKPVVFAIVADGIGGHRAGEIAAELAVNYISHGVSEGNAYKPIKTLQDAIEDASQAIAAHSAGKAEQEGMGSTCACAWVIGNQLYTAHVGDSRIYLMRGEKIKRITKDHTWVQEAMDKGIITPEQAHDHPNVHVIRRYLGSLALPKVDFRMWLLDEIETDDEAKSNQGLELEPADIILLCSDGLTDLVWEDEVFKIVRSKKELNSAAEILVNTANERGGHDNITVILMEVPKLEEMQKEKKKPGFFNWLTGKE